MLKVDKSLRNNSGIYKLRNTTTEEIYVGSAKCIYTRVHNHFCLLRRNKHHNKHLQSSFNKYSETSFTYDVLENCNPEDLLIREQYWIDLLKPKYNKNPIVTQPFIRSWTQEERKKASEKQKEVNRNRIKNPSNKPILVYDLDGKFVEEYEGITVFANLLKTNPHLIGKALRYYTGRYKNYQLRYKYNDDRPVEKYKRPKRQLKRKITDEIISNVLYLLRNLIPSIAIADMYNISRRSINKISNDFNLTFSEKEKHIIRHRAALLTNRVKINSKIHGEIEDLFKKGMPQTEIAKKFNVNISTIASLNLKKNKI